MKTSKLFILLLSVIVLFSGCASQSTSTIVGCNYDEKKNVTNYFVIPYGSVDLPGVWEKTEYNSIARQQFFKNKDDVHISIAFSPWNKYEFNGDGKLKGNDFTSAYYKWESDYFISNGFESQLIETDTAHQFIIFRIYSDKANNYFLIGERNGHVSNYSVQATDRWSDQERIDFLKKLYLQDQ